MVDSLASGSFRYIRAPSFFVFFSRAALLASKNSARAFRNAAAALKNGSRPSLLMRPSLIEEKFVQLVSKLLIARRNFPLAELDTKAAEFSSKSLAAAISSTTLAVYAVKSSLEIVALQVSSP